MSAFKHLNEADTCDRLITPAIKKAGFEMNEIYREYKITDGKIIDETDDGKAIRENPMFADYYLTYKDFPLAIVEAKKTKAKLSEGMPQAKLYAKKLNIPFAFSSNGRGFLFFNDLTKETIKLEMDEFPNKEELLDLYMDFFNFSETDRKNILSPFYHSQSYVKKARYYQKIAVNKVVESVIRGEKRQLLVMATGCGKTFTAFQISHKLLSMVDENGNKMFKKILFLADRNILVDQTMSNDFNPLSKRSNKIQINSKDFTTAYDIYFSIYQQLSLKEKGVVVSDGEDCLSNLKSKFPPDYFDIIFVDECHRGGVQEGSAWRGILDYFSSAIQIGLTATPKNKKNPDDDYTATSEYFGEPVYTYSLAQGIEDGYLAPYRVLSIKTNVDSYGVDYGSKHYNSKKIDRTVIIDERSKVVAKRITEYLRKTNPYQRTIVFCVDTEHADRMRNALIECNRDLVNENSEYVVRITGDDVEGKALLDKFIDSEETYPVIATTSKLLTTGVDCKTCKLIVLDSNIESMALFKQILGRGTRICEEHNKSTFTIMDFRDVALNKFSDADFDGTPLSVGVLEKDDDDLGDKLNDMFSQEHKNSIKNKEKEENELREKLHIDAGVKIIKEETLALNENGEDITNELKNNYRLLFEDEFNNIDDFNENFLEAMKSYDTYKKFTDKYSEKYQLNFFVADEEIDFYDKFNHVIFDKPIITKDDRINIRKSDLEKFLNSFNDEQKEILWLFLEEYKNNNIKSTASAKVFDDLNSLQERTRGMKNANKIFDKKLKNTLNELTKILYGM